MRKLSECSASHARAMLAASAIAMAAAHAATDDPCARAGQLAGPGWRIDSMGIAPSGDPAPHCVVKGAVASGTANSIAFELRLPLNWNERLLFQGGGGLDGSVRPALGSIPLAGAKDRPTALARGYAVVSMDGGHEGDGAAFAADEQAWLDFAYASAPKVTRAAKEMVTRFYGQAPRHSYFMGCSNGGREAMIAAERDPGAFDGIVAGNPGFNLAGSALEETWETALLARSAPRDAAEHPLIAEALGDADLALVADAVARQCDKEDGLADGLVFDHSCKFDPQVLACTPGRGNAACLPAPKLELVRALFAGSQPYGGWPYDTGITAAAWRKQKLGTARSGPANSGNAVRGAQAWYEVLLRQPIPERIESPEQVLAAADRAEPRARQLNATATRLDDFVARGGKLLVYQGMSDPVFSSTDLIAWYQRAQQDTVAAQGRPWMRLFLSPAMGHCGGGPGLDDFDPLEAIEGWVERGDAPERIVARNRAAPGTTRPLCAYPRFARYDGKGPVDDAASFSCSMPGDAQ